MKTKICNVTIINLQGTKSYCLDNTYNGLLLDRIVDNTVEFESELICIYTGFTKESVRVFEVINVPIEVQYEEDK